MFLTTEDQVRIAEVLRAAADPALAQKYVESLSPSVRAELASRIWSHTTQARVEVSELHVGRPLGAP